MFEMTAILAEFKGFVRLSIFLFHRALFIFSNLSYNYSIMFVIIKHGGKQYWAEPGSVLSLERINGTIGDVVTLDGIASDVDGALSVAAREIKGVILKHYRDKKVIAFKKQKRHHYERKKGHRQHLTLVKIA